MLVAFVSIVLIGIWLVGAYMALEHKKFQLTHQFWVSSIAGVLGVAGIFGESYVPHWFSSIAPEFIGISITILVIDNLNEKRANRQEKQRILEQLGSYSNNFALDALRIATRKDWILDGSLRRLYLHGANLKNAFLTMADMREVKLVAANLQFAKLACTKLDEADLERADLQNTHLENSSLVRAHLVSAKLHNASLVGANLTKSNLVDAVLKKADLWQAKLSYTKLVGADFSEARLLEANLEYADLRGAILTSADLRGAILTGAKIDDRVPACSSVQIRLDKTDLNGAWYDCYTVWPEGFDFRQSGAILIE